MARQNKDLYSILGLNPDASQEEIRSAYLARTRIIHPDKIDKKLQPKDWEQANAMLSELNEAYKILKDPYSRKEYDRSRSSRVETESASRTKSQEPSFSSSPFSSSEISTGYTTYSSLSEGAQKRFLKRQDGKDNEVIKIKIDSLNGNYFYVVLCFLWFWFVLNDAQTTQWHESTLLWYVGLTAVVVYFLNKSAVKIFNWSKSHRALAVKNPEGLSWFWVGNHSDYDRLIK